MGLLLTLAAGFIYLTMPLALLFSFFVYTESMVTRLLMQWIAIYIRTLILQGLIVVFLMLLMGAAQSGSLTAYLGLVGVGIVGGFFLIQMASSIMKESLAMSLGAVGAIWKGTATTALGKGAERPAEVAFGAAKLAAAGAAMAATAGSPGGAWSTLDMADPALTAGRSGLGDLKGGARQYGERPDAISRLASKAESNLPTGGWEDVGSWGATAALTLPGWSTANGKEGGKSERSPRGPKEDPVEAWTRSFYEAKEKGHGRQQIEAEGRDLLGEKMSRLARESMERRSQAETAAALKAAGSVAQSEEMFDEKGRLRQEAVQAVRARMGDQAQAFSGKQGAGDLAVLAAVAAQPRKTVEADQLRQAAAAAGTGRGRQAPGRVVPQAVGLDPVAAGAHFSAMNRFSRVGEQAGLTVEQREQLLQEAHSDGGVSTELRRQIETSLHQRQQQDQGQAAGLRVEDVIAGAEAMPRTLHGPAAVQLPDEGSSQPAPAAAPAPARVQQPAAPAPSARPKAGAAPAAAAPAPAGRVTPATTTQTTTVSGGSGFDDPLAPPRREKKN